MLPVRRREGAARDFPQERFEVAQPVHWLRGEPVAQLFDLRTQPSRITRLQ